MTRSTQNRVPQGVLVRFRPGAPSFAASQLRLARPPCSLVAKQRSLPGVAHLAKRGDTISGAAAQDANHLPSIDLTSALAERLGFRGRGAAAEGAWPGQHL